jgi:hypothetical protein
MSILDPYLPKGGGGASSQTYAEGGALFALGLIHANKSVAAVVVVNESMMYGYE